MTKINLITPPDKLYNDSTSILLMYPGGALQNSLQYEILPNITDSLNLYYYDKGLYDKEEVDWLLTVFNMCDICIIDIDRCEPFIKDILGYFICKSKTYWLTNAEKSVYNHLSNNRIYDLSILSHLGGISEESVQTE